MQEIFVLSLVTIFFISGLWILIKQFESVCLPGPPASSPLLQSYSSRGAASLAWCLSSAWLLWALGLPLHWTDSYLLTEGFCMVPSLKLSTNLMSRESGRENVVMYSWYFRMGTLSIAHIVRLLQRGPFGERERETDLCWSCDFQDIFVPFCNACRVTLSVNGDQSQ